MKSITRIQVLDVPKADPEPIKKDRQFRLPETAVPHRRAGKNQ